MAKLGRAHVMLAQEMVDRSVSVRQVATQLGVDESTLRYRLKRPLTSGAALAHLLIWIISAWSHGRISLASVDTQNRPLMDT